MFPKAKTSGDLRAFDAVIFDCDGVLVDSELLGNEVLAEVLTDHGLPMTTQQSMSTFMGRSMQGIIDRATELAAERGREDADVDIRTVCQVHFLSRLSAAFEQRLRAIEGMDALLSRLALPRAVASSSPAARLWLSLRTTGLARHFGEHVYSVDRVARPKPAPDVFLFAAERLGVLPARCVVVEDSPGGVAAAKAAGMHVLGFVGGGHCGPDHAQRLHAAGVQAGDVARCSADLARLLGMPPTAEA